MKVRSWGRASRSVGNKPVDFLLDSFFKNIQRLCRFLHCHCWNMFQHFRKNNAWKFVWSLSCWHLIGQPQNPIQPAVRWRAFGCLRRPWNFDEDAGCVHQAHGHQFLGLLMVGVVVFFCLVVCLIACFVLVCFVLSCFGLFVFFCWLCLCIFACLQAFTQTYWWLMSLFCHDVDDGDDADCRSRCRIDDGCVVDCCSRWWRWC